MATRPVLKSRPKSEPCMEGRVRSYSDFLLETLLILYRDGMFSVDVKTRLLTDDQGHLSIIGTSASEPRPTRSGVPVDAVGAGSFSPTLSHLCARGENDHQTVKSNMDAEELYKVETVAKELSKKRNSPFAFVGTGLVTVNREAQAPVPFPPTNADSISDTVIVSDTDLGVVPWHFK